MNAPLSLVRDCFQIAWYFVGIVALGAGAWQYRRSVRLEQEKWAVQLFEKFFEAHDYKKVRNIIDSDPPSQEVDELVKSESSELTDYLNFFELIAILTANKQVRKGEVQDLFDYYLRCLKRHPSLLHYINTPSRGFERLRVLLVELK